MNTEYSLKLEKFLDRYDEQEIIENFKPCIKLAIQTSATTYVLLELLINNLKIDDNSKNYLKNKCEDILFSVYAYKLPVDTDTGIYLEIFKVFEKKSLNLNELLESNTLDESNYNLESRIRNYVEKWMTEKTRDFKYKTTTIQSNTDLRTSIINPDGSEMDQKTIEFHERMNQAYYKDIDAGKKKRLETLNIVFNKISTELDNYGFQITNENDQNFFKLIKLTKKDKYMNEVDTYLYLTLCIGVYFNIHIGDIWLMLSKIYGLENIFLLKIPIFYDTETYQPLKNVKETMKTIIESLPKDNPISKNIETNWKKYYITYSIDGTNFINLLRSKEVTKNTIDNIENKLRNTQYNIDQFYEHEIKNLCKDLNINKTNLNKYFKYTTNPYQKVYKKLKKIEKEEEEEEEEDDFLDLIFKTKNIKMN